MVAGVEIRVRFPVQDQVEQALQALHEHAFGATRLVQRPWAQRLERHSLTWVGAFDGAELVGFVQVCWDGGAHAFLLDTAVAASYRRRGIGQEMVRVAAAQASDAGCEWLHVDYEPQLRGFYEQSCGFVGTASGLLRLRP